MAKLALLYCVIDKALQPGIGNFAERSLEDSNAISIIRHPAGVAFDDDEVRAVNCSHNTGVPKAAAVI